MSSRHRAREGALQVLYLLDMSKQPVSEAIDSYYGSLSSEECTPQAMRDPFLEQLVRGTITEIAATDERITRHAEHWRIERMPTVDRNILRLAIYEMLYCMETPPIVAINEALEIAKKFGGEDSARFVNGILDKVKAELTRPLREASRPDAMQPAPPASKPQAGA